MNRLLFDFESGLPDAELDKDWPRTTLEDTGSAFVLRAEVPGLDEKAIELSVDESSVRLKGERPDLAPEGYSVHRKERAAYRFARSFALPTKADPEKVEAVVKSGVLTVTLPKAKEAQPRQISVRGS
jgi:HSP20 family protein